MSKHSGIGGGGGGRWYQMGKITKSIPPYIKCSNRTGVCGWKMVVGNDDVRFNHTSIECLLLFIINDDSSIRSIFFD